MEENKELEEITVDEIEGMEDCLTEEINDMGKGEEDDQE